MKAHRIFNKGDYCYALLSSFTQPNVLIPCRGKIIDTQWDPVNPLYKIQILTLYDHITFIKKYMIGMRFTRDFAGRSRRMPLKAEDLTNIRALEKRFDEKDRERFYVVVESVMCKKTRYEMRDLFNKVQLHLVSKRLKKVKEDLSRPFYTGIMNIDSPNEFDKRFKVGWADKFKNLKIDIDKYLKSL